MITTKPYLSTDFYKVAHAMDVTGTNIPALHPTKIEVMYETLVPRSNHYFPYDDKMVAFGYELFVQELLLAWNEHFFGKPWAEIKKDFQVYSHMAAGVQDSVVAKFERLHELGFLPLEIRALPEGTLVPMRVPVLTIQNTIDEFYWLPGYLETTLLSNTFVTSTVASVARQFRKIATEYADKTSDNTDFIDFQFHDFSQRGQHGDEASIISGLAHLTSFKGTDAVPAVFEAQKIWGETDPNEMFGGSVIATEHSIMESLAGEFGTDLRGQVDAWESLIDRNPSGILSVVADTYDYWEVVDDVLPMLKDKIMARDGKLVIRPDSLAEFREKGDEKIETSAKLLAVTLEALYETFGGTVNSKGYKVLDPHVGVLLGEGITLENVRGFFDKIVAAGFSTENVVLGVGAYVYSVKVSRDDFAQALKATNCVIDGKEVAIFKDPQSQAASFKRSPKGAVAVIGESGEYKMIEGLTLEQAHTYEGNQLDVIYKQTTNDAKPEMKLTPFSVIRERIKDDIDK